MALIALILMSGCALSALAQPISPPAKESLIYNVEWRLISAGKAHIEFLANPPSRPGYLLNLRLESTGLVSKLFKVQDEYAAQLSSALCIQSSQMQALEGKRQRETKITFDGGKAIYLERDVLNNATVLSKEIDIPACVHDVAGGLYLMRTLNLEPGQSTLIPVSDGKKSVGARVEAQQREDVKTPAGTFKAMRFEVYLFNGILYQRPARLYVWISDDRARLPVQLRVRMQFAIGTITLQLEKHE